METNKRVKEACQIGSTNYVLGMSYLGLLS